MSQLTDEERKRTAATLSLIGELANTVAAGNQPDMVKFFNEIFAIYPNGPDQITSDIRAVMTHRSSTIILPGDNGFTH